MKKLINKNVIKIDNAIKKEESITRVAWKVLVTVKIFCVRLLIISLLVLWIWKWYFWYNMFENTFSLKSWPNLREKFIVAIVNESLITAEAITKKINNEIKNKFILNLLLIFKRLYKKIKKELSSKISGFINKPTNGIIAPNVKTSKNEEININKDNNDNWIFLFLCKFLLIDKTNLKTLDEDSLIDLFIYYLF